MEVSVDWKGSCRPRQVDLVDVKGWSPGEKEGWRGRNWRCQLFKRGLCTR